MGFNSAFKVLKLNIEVGDCVLDQIFHLVYIEEERRTTEDKKSINVCL
jgi:hypothetical protein